MKQIYQDYMIFLKAFVQGTAPELSDTTALPQILNMARIHSTAGIIGYVMMSCPGFVDAEFQAFMRKQCLSEVALYSRRAEQMKELIRQMNDCGIDHLLFKGYIVRDYYRVPELRTFGDIDFVIRKSDRQKSDELMKSLGFEVHENWEPVFSYLKGTEYYEIHTDVMEVDVSDKADYKGYYSHIWEHAVQSNDPERPHTYEFTPEFHFLYLLTHIAKHISSSGAGIRMYMDIAFFIEHFGDGIDWKWISLELEKLQLQEFSNFVLNAVEQWFGIVSPLPLRAVSDEVLDDFLEFTLEGGTYGKVGREKSLIFLKQQNRNEEKVSRIRTLLFHIFPPAANLENRYSYLQGRHWLLPAAWIHRLIGNRDSWGRYVHNAKSIVNTDSEEVKKLKRIYREIGL